MLRGQIEVTGTLQYSRAGRVLVGSPPSTARVLDEFSSTREALAGLCLAAAAHAIDIPNKAQHRLLPRGIVSCAWNVKLYGHKKQVHSRPIMGSLSQTELPSKDHKQV